MRAELHGVPALARTVVRAPLGAFEVAASPTGLAWLLTPREPRSRRARYQARFDEPCKDATTPLLEAAEAQLRAYFAGERREFDLPLDLRGTPFQQRVWAALRRIPHGETRSYGQLARSLGQPQAARAVAAAIGANPVAVVVPCHRVIGKDGTLTGFAGGLAMKRKLLELEQAGT
jgi:methylated-DNA-[protein]-cysteine S-methyltransferase